jgi:glycine hydroxymethyltransferase
MAHIACLVAVGLHPSPVPHADVVTTTTHKTLRGPRAGLILCKEKWARDIDRAIFPGTQGGPLMHIIAAKAVALGEAFRPEFARYQQRILDNARALAAGLAARGLRIVSGGTDNHLALVDLRAAGVTGKEAEKALDAVRITVNKNMIPYDPNPPNVTSGIRVGSPAVTTRGFGTKEMEIVADCIAQVVYNSHDEEVRRKVLERTQELCCRFPVPGIESLDE